MGEGSISSELKRQQYSRDKALLKDDPKFLIIKVKSPNSEIIRRGNGLFCASVFKIKRQLREAAGWLLKTVLNFSSVLPFRFSYCLVIFDSWSQLGQNETGIM